MRIQQEEGKRSRTGVESRKRGTNELPDSRRA